MKLIKEYVQNKPVYETITWDEHAARCGKCMNVDLAQTSSFVFACALGSKLLNEKAKEIQRPVQQKRAKEVRDWAEKAGVFKL